MQSESFSGWLYKAKDDSAKLKWFRTWGKRHFTIDFECRFLAYSCADGKKCSRPIPFADILGASLVCGEQQEPCGAARSLMRGISRRPVASGRVTFLLETAARTLHLAADSVCDARRWIDLFIQASSLRPRNEAEGTKLGTSPSMLSPMPSASSSSSADHKVAPKCPSQISGAPLLESVSEPLASAAFNEMGMEAVDRRGSVKPPLQDPIDDSEALAQAISACLAQEPIIKSRASHLELDLSEDVLLWENGKPAQAAAASLRTNAGCSPAYVSHEFASSSSSYHRFSIEDDEAIARAMQDAFDHSITAMTPDAPTHERGSAHELCSIAGDEAIARAMQEEEGLSPELATAAGSVPHDMWDGDDNASDAEQRSVEDDEVAYWRAFVGPSSEDDEAIALALHEDTLSPSTASGIATQLASLMQDWAEDDDSASDDGDYLVEDNEASAQAARNLVDGASSDSGARRPGDEESEHDECVICLEDMLPTDEREALPCGHTFHRGCAAACIRRHGRICPLCRNTF